MWKFLLLTLALISVLCLTSALGISCTCDEMAENFEGLETEECAPGCLLWMTVDKKCDSVCNVGACNYDGGRCSGAQPTEYISYCAPGCPWSYVGDGYCDAYYCNNAACDYDGGDCTCAAGCTTEMLNNDVCDWACNLYDCNYDNGRCNK